MTDQTRVGVQPKVLVQRFVEEVWNNGDLDVADELLAPDYTEHSGDGEGYKKPAGPAGMKHFVSLFRVAFPDLKFTIQEMIVEGNAVAVRLEGHGTHLGDFLEFPATGKPVTVKGAAIHHIDGDKIAESYEFVDRMGLRAQLVG